MEADLDKLPPALGAAARTVARRLAGAGHRAWIVGGAARDLVLGTSPKDLDLVSAATPEEVEALFERTIPVGRAFGIVVVRLDGLQVEVATFRSERGYSDGRRPDEVAWGTSLEEDAGRRDFTCNALYLDPLTGELADPTGGRADLAAGRLRCVGEARDRFAEDGLRILRLARFAARLEAQPEPETLAAARASLDALRGVSPERVREELERMFSGPRTHRALALLGELDALARVLPGWAAASRVELARRLSALASFGRPPGTVRGFAVLLEPDPLGEDGGEGDATPGLDVLERLRPSRALRDTVAQVLALRREIPALARPDAARAARILALRDAPWQAAIDVARAWRSVAGAPRESLEELDRLAAWRGALAAADLHPAPLLSAADLAAAGVPRGPRWGALLRAAERAQLDGELGDPAAARAWLAARA